MTTGQALAETGTHEPSRMARRQQQSGLKV